MFLYEITNHGSRPVDLVPVDVNRCLLRHGSVVLTELSDHIVGKVTEVWEKEEYALIELVCGGELHIYVLPFHTLILQ